MVFYKQAEDWEQWMWAIAPDDFAEKAKEALIDNNKWNFAGEYAKPPYFDIDSIDVRVDESMRTAYVYAKNRRKESFFVQLDFSEPMDSIYVNHEGDTVYYYNRVICIYNFIDLIKGSAAFDLDTLGSSFKENLPYRLFDLKGRLSVIGSGTIIEGKALWSDELSLNFKLCTQFVADEEYKDLLSRLENRKNNTNFVNIDAMDGHEFESFCAEVLRNNGFSNVEVTKGSGDQGIDVLATKDFVKYGFQCKCYSSDIGNKAVQEAHAGKTYYGCHVAVVLTNRYFTPSAERLADQTGVVLWDRDRLLAMMTNVDPTQMLNIGFSDQEVDASLNGAETEVANQIKEVIDSMKEVLVDTNRQGDDGMLFGVSDSDLQDVFMGQITQYAFWIIDAGVFATKKDAQVISILSEGRISSEEIDELISDDFVPYGFESEEPSAIFALARVMAMLGAGDPYELVMPLYELLGELLVSIEPLWGEERKERVDEYCSMLRENLAMI